MQGQFDIIVIGSGLGGLECGAMLAREGMGVCVTEQADVPGGCLQSFSRRDMRSTRACTTSAACRPAASCAVTSNISASSARCACGRSTRHSTSCRCPERATTPTCTVTKPSKSTSGNCSRTKRRGSAATARSCAKSAAASASGCTARGGCRPGERNTSGHRRPDSSANASQTRCCAMSSRGRTPSTEACAKARRSTTTRW